MTKFEAFVLEHFIKHKPLIFEEGNVNFLDEEKKITCFNEQNQKYHKILLFYFSLFLKKLVIIHENIYNLVLKKKKFVKMA